jgi:hypothetical protein
MMNATPAGSLPHAIFAHRSGALVAVGAFLFMLALSWTQIPLVWLSGAFGDTDDAMRMAQVRDLLGGQSWFDLVQKRMAAPEGAPMHWTRVVDAPLYALIRLFALAMEAARAEALARLVYSFALLALLLAASARLARTLMGEAGVAPALVAMALSGAVFGQFVWGRIDHHALQLVLLLFLMDAVLRALDPQEWRAAVAAAIFAVLSLCVSAENVPLVAAASAVLPLRWAFDGEGCEAMKHFAFAFAVALLAGALLFIPAGAQAASACDAFSYAYVFAGLCGGVGLLTLCAFYKHFPTRAARVGALVLCGALAAGCVAFLFPQCLRHPYASIDPLVRDIWLGNVPEARSFFTLLRDDALEGAVFAAPLLLATCALAVALARSQGLVRLRWIALSGFGLVACGLVLMEVRSFWQALFVLTWGVCDAGLRAAHRWRTPWLAFALVALASPFFWALGKAFAHEAPIRASAACYAPESYAALARLSPGRILAPINLGAHILAHTRHDVMGGAYHRLSRANRALLDMFLAPPDEARNLIRAAGVRYVATCFDAHTLASLTARAPHGLAAALAQEDPPEWLREASIRNAPLRVYELR